MGIVYPFPGREVFIGWRRYTWSISRNVVLGQIFLAFTELMAGIKGTEKGGTYYSPTVQAIIREFVNELALGKEGKDVAQVGDGIASLSNQEKEVFVLLADGLPVKKIADRLCLSHKTVETQKYNIMEKLNVKTLAGFTKIALKKDLIDT